MKLLLPKIVKFIFSNNNNVPKNFIQNVDEIFQIWRDKWEIFDHKYFQGLFIYLFNYDSNDKIEKFYSNYIKNELDKYSYSIEYLNLIEPQKVKALGAEYGLDINSASNEIIDGLKKIKKMENNYSINNTNNNNNNNNEIEEDEKTIDKNNEVSNNKDNDFNDIDGEPL